MQACLDSILLAVLKDSEYFNLCTASVAGPGIYTSVVFKLWIPAVDGVNLISFLSLCVFGQLTLTSLDSRLLKRDDSMNLSGSL